MGILNFLSKKPGGEREGNKNSAKLLKSRAYDSTTAANPPIRGTFPVAGNGPNILESLSRLQTRANQSQLSLNAQSIADRPAPSPKIPWSRDEAIAERPRTAPGGAQSTAQWSNPYVPRRRDSAKGSRPVRMDHGPSTAGQVLDDVVELEQPRAASFVRHPRIMLPHQRNDSIRSETSRFKDILDAQSELKPSNFRNRVRAAGVRDYGEDVADRNIGENGVDLESAEVQAFYASSKSHPLAEETFLGARGSVASEIPRQNAPHPARQSQQETWPRTQSLTASAPYEFPKRTTSHVPHIPSFLPPGHNSGADALAPPPKNSEKRRSLNVYNDASPVIPNAGSKSQLRPLSYYRSGPQSKQRRSRAIYAESDEWDTDLDRTDDVDQLRNISAPRPLGRGRFPVVPSRVPAEFAIPNGHDDDSRFSENDLYIRPGSQRGLGLVSSSVAALSLNKRHSLHTFQSSVSSTVTSRTPSIDFTPLAYPRDKLRGAAALRGSVAAFDGLVGANGGDSAPSPNIAPRSVPDDESRATTPRLNRFSSMGSPTPGRLDDGSDHTVPRRANSLRHWSISSQATTPTYSDASSNPFQRPPSRHTIDTSVDLNNPTSLKSSSCSTLERGFHQRVEPTAASGDFNFDDYISSDDDLVSPSRPRAEGEEDLLFQDTGYGEEGMQLPGLFDGANTITPPRASSMVGTRTPPNGSSPNRRASVHRMQGYGSPLSATGGRAGGPFYSPASRRRYILDTAADDSDSDSEYDSHYDYDAQGKQQEAGAGFGGIWHDLPHLSPLRGNRGSKRLSALGGSFSSFGQYSNTNSSNGNGGPLGAYGFADDVIEEELEEKPDVLAAVRARKAAKARERAAIAEKNGRRRVKDDDDVAGRAVGRA